MRQLNNERRKQRISSARAPWGWGEQDLPHWRGTRQASTALPGFESSRASRGN